MYITNQYMGTDSPITTDHGRRREKKTCLRRCKASAFIYMHIFIALKGHSSRIWLFQAAVSTVCVVFPLSFTVVHLLFSGPFDQ